MEDLGLIVKKLISIPSVSGDFKQIEKVSRQVESYFLKNNKLFVKRYETKNIPSLVITSKENKMPAKFMVGHIDVVPASTPDQFKPVVKGNRLYGRGSADMKGQVAAMIIAYLRLAKDGKHDDVGLVLTCDEEMGGQNGVGYLIKKKLIQPKLVIVPDGARAKQLTMVTAEKGILRVHLEVVGKSAHGSRPFLGKNAADLLISDYARIQKLFINPKYEEDWRPSVNLGVIKSGETVNMVPDQASLDLDIRVIKPEELKSIAQKIRQTVQHSKVKIGMTEYPVYTSGKNVHLQKLKQIYESQTGRKVKFEKACGASDGRYFHKIGATVLFPLPIGANYHGKDEWVDIKSLDDLSKTLYAFFSSPLR